MKKLLGVIFLSLLLSACNQPPSPQPNPPSPTPPTPIDPSGHATGYIKSNPTVPGLLPGATWKLATDVPQLPRKFNWVTAGYSVPIRDQGGCGSCWAFGSAAPLEFAVKIYDGKDIDLAEQELVANLYGGCGGGDFSMDWLVNKGLVFESKCPYTASNRQCPGGVPSSFDYKAKAGYNLGDQVGAKPTVQQIKEAIYKFGPVAVTVAAGGGFGSYKSGVMSGCGSTSINHIISIVGWDEDLKSWVVRNEWGTGWGEQGYAKMPYGCNRIADEVAFIEYSPAPAYTMIPGGER